MNLRMNVLISLIFCSLSRCTPVIYLTTAGRHWLATVMWSAAELHVYGSDLMERKYGGFYQYTLISHTAGKKFADVFHMMNFLRLYIDSEVFVLN